MTQIEDTLRFEPGFGTGPRPQSQFGITKGGIMEHRTFGICDDTCQACHAEFRRATSGPPPVGEEPGEGREAELAGVA